MEWATQAEQVERVHKRNAALAGLAYEMAQLLEAIGAGRCDWCETLGHTGWCQVPAVLARYAEITGGKK